MKITLKYRRNISKAMGFHATTTTTTMAVLNIIEPSFPFALNAEALQKLRSAYSAVPSLATSCGKHLSKQLRGE